MKMASCLTLIRTLRTQLTAAAKLSILHHFIGNRNFGNAAWTPHFGGAWAQRHLDAVQLYFVNIINKSYFISFVVRRSLVVTFAAFRLQGSRFKPRSGQKFETRFLLHA